MSKKQRERRQFNSFCDAIRWPELKSAVDDEEPDFTYDSGSGAILGVELADLYSDQKKAGGSPTRANEATFDSFYETLKDEFSQRNPRAAVAIDLCRSRHGPCQRREISNAAAHALSSIESAFPTLPPGQMTSVWSREDHPGDVLGTFVDRIQMCKLHGLTKTVWSSVNIGFGLDKMAPPVIDLVLEKERLRSTRYANRCNQVWLVLVATGVSGASLIDEVEFDASGLPPNGFERIYLFEEISKHAVAVQGA